MAGTATNNDVTVIANSPGQLWAGLAIPAGGAALTLDTDGTPDATANPSAIHLGMTREGAVFNVKPAFEQFYADEFSSPIKVRMTALEATLSAELLQITDADVLQKITAGFGTYSSALGYERTTFGVGVQSYTSIALIFPTEADVTKFAVFHLYKAFNENGLDSVAITRKGMSGINVMFRGVDITTRTATDTVGAYWKQV